MTNIFVLCTGRCGSTTFSKAAALAEGYTSGHETRTHLVGPARLAYPANHIETDNRLTWFLGRLEAEWGDKARYVHLIRDPQQTAESFVRRYDRGIMLAYRSEILMRSAKLSADIPPIEFAKDYIDTVTTNIDLFLSRRKHVITIRLETIEEDFGTFWRWAGLEGDLSAAAEVWKTHYNASK